MMYYRDMTFCPKKDCEKFQSCNRALTQEVHQKAGSIGMLISVYNINANLDCYLKKDNQQEGDI